MQTLTARISLGTRDDHDVSNEGYGRRHNGAPDVLLCSYYGEDNLGDALLQVLLQEAGASNR